MYKLRLEGLRRETSTPTLKLFEEHENLRGKFEENEFDCISSIYNDAVIDFDENNDLSLGLPRN